MALKHIAPTIRATIASLKAGMAARVAAFNAEPENEVALVEPADDSYIFGGDDQLERHTAPIIEVYISSGELGEADIERAMQDVDDRLVVTVWAEGVSGEVPEIYETVVGYGRCILEVLLQTGAFGEGAEIKDQPGAVSYQYLTIPTASAEDRSFDQFRTAGVFSFALEDVTPTT